MAVNFPRQECYFEDEPAVVYRFENQPVDPVFHLNLIENSASHESGNSFVSEIAKLADRKSDDGPREISLPAETTRVHKTQRARLSKSDPLICCGLSELSSRESQRLEKFLEGHIVGDPNKPGATSLTEHKIDVGGHAPVKQRYYPVSPKIQEAIYAEVDKMLAAGIIEPSKSEWSSPIVMIKKPNGSYRFCLDFRKLNSVSKKDAYPLPYMNAILDKLRSASYISTIDLSQAYFQIPLERNSRELTAFTVPGKGLFHFTRMPYGLTGAPATFQRLLDRLIGPEMEPHAFAYLDDIVVVTRTFEEHLSWLKRVLDRIREAGLTINPEKSKFCRSQVKYLGFLIQQEGLKVDPDKTAPIVEYPPPRNIKQLRRFIGMASWYRRFIPQCATLLEPLTRLLRKGFSWEWGDEQKAAFDSIKSCITSPPTLSCPNFELPFVLQTDASSVDLGAVLTQESEGVEHVIAFASRALSEAEKKYSTTEQECLAVVWSIKKFRPYLEGYTFKVITDHSSLRWLHNLKNPTGRLAR
ncbi:Reverse ribonuclease integrase [Camponotus japonicus]